MKKKIQIMDYNPFTNLFFNALTLRHESFKSFWIMHAYTDFDVSKREKLYSVSVVLYLKP